MKRKEDNEYEDRWESENSEVYLNFYGSEKKMNDIWGANDKNNPNLYYYMYLCENSTGAIEDFRIYFIDEKVVWMAFR